MTYKSFTATPVISAAGIYASGDALGGLLTFEDVCSAFEPGAEIVGAYLIDQDKESVLTKLLLFDRSVTPTADNSPLDVSDADLLNLIAVIEFPAASYVALNDNSVCHVEPDIPIKLVDAGTDLFGLLATYGTPTYTAVNDLIVKLIVRT